MPSSRLLRSRFFPSSVLTTRCANYRDVVIAGNIYFTDADCYARMTRARLCLQHPGLVLRHHTFENFPAGTTPHTTVPFDYLIAALAVTLKPITSQALDLAGAIISPLLALLAGWFLWWWSRRERLPYRGALLLLYALSPILVHGTAFGRPDHQSLLVCLIAVAVCAEWTLRSVDPKIIRADNSLLYWSLVSGAAWGLALWVSLYEPLVLLAALIISQLLFARKSFLAWPRPIGWALCGGIVLIALALEQRLPVWPRSSQFFSNWAATIGELRHVLPDDSIWLRWTGLLLIPWPALLWIAVRRTRMLPAFLAVLLMATFALTVWQARWAYFFAMLFALALPACLGVFRNRIAGWVVLAISFFPIFTDWDENFGQANHKTR